jgi:hypothetical protein
MNVKWGLSGKWKKISGRIEGMRGIGRMNMTHVVSVIMKPFVIHFCFCLLRQGLTVIAQAGLELAL